MGLHLLGTFIAPGLDPTAVFPNAPKSLGIVTIRIYYEESNKHFRIQMYPYFEQKTGLKLQIYPKQVKIFSKYSPLRRLREMPVSDKCPKEPPDACKPE